MIDWLVWFASWALVLLGCLFVVAGAIGLVRLPDLYTRLHAASVTDTGGAIVLSLALILQAVFVFGNPLAAIKLVLILFFTLFTAPTASHALAKTALLSGKVPLDGRGRPILDSPETAARLARSRPDPDTAAGAGSGSGDEPGSRPESGPESRPGSGPAGGGA